MKHGFELISKRSLMKLKVFLLKEIDYETVPLQQSGFYFPKVGFGKLI